MEPYIEIAGRRIGKGYPAYIVAEMGINHNGDINLALELIGAASEVGVDAVKVQIVNADRSYTKDSVSYKIFKNAEFIEEQWERIAEQGKASGIDVFATFTTSSELWQSEELGLPCVKISSSNITNFPLLEAITKLGKPVIMSTGMGYLGEVDKAIRFLEKNGQQQISLLQCTSLYPTRAQDVNLRAMRTLGLAFPKYPIGFSDHTLGIHCAIAAVALGARIIEKHFTLDRSMEGPDHHFSSDPTELKCLLEAIREVELALGSSAREPVEEEIILRDKFQRSLVASLDIEAGDLLKLDNISAKRSGRPGIAPEYFDIVTARVAKKRIPKGTPITWDLI